MVGIDITWHADHRAMAAHVNLGAEQVHDDVRLRVDEKALVRGRVVTVNVVPVRPLRLDAVRWSPEVGITADDRMFVNGYQSWTQSREFARHEKIPGVPWFLRTAVGAAGEDPLRRAHAQHERFHSWTYTYFRHADNTITLIGSTDESFAYTILDYDFRSGRLLIEKELEGVEVREPATPLRLYIGKGDEVALWDEYSSLWEHRRPLGRRLSGWTSWYYHYTHISEEVIGKNLEAMRQAKLPIDVFQIDDGYQSGLGDWLETNAKFPSGMGALAQKIRAAGYRPGLWLAPFVCDAKSKLWAEHPEWILRDERRRPVKAGWNPLWHGDFYALDFYAPGLQDYLRRVFRTVLDDWGFGLVKLDFLFAVAMKSRPERSRGRIMCEAMQFLREVVGEHWLLGCGAPLGPAFGQVDLCRIGSDVAGNWDNPLQLVGSRERPSTFNSLNSTLGRWPMSRRCFGNDPDVFILRDRKNRLTPRERATLLLVNYLLGDVLFVSDDMSEYTDEQLRQIRSMYPLVLPTVRTMRREGGCHHISLAVGDTRYEAYVNLGNREAEVVLGATAFSVDTGPQAKGTVVPLAPHQAVCFRVLPEQLCAPAWLGTSGHLLPGAEVSSVAVQGGDFDIAWHEQAAADSTVFLLVADGTTSVRANGRVHAVQPTQSALGPIVTIPRL
jgi:alpha-galactosidase